MAGIDFSQTTFDHRCMLVLVLPVGNIPRQQFQRIYTLLRSRYQRVSLPNANRVVRLKFVQNVHAHESRIWGTLHMHKHVLGLFCIGDLTKTNDQFAQLNQKFQDTLTQYSETLFDSRFIIMTDQSLPDQTEAIVINLQNYQHVLSTAIPEFGASLFWILDSKRVEKLNEKPDKMTMLKISLENDSGSQDDSGYKKKCAGRNKKRLGDLCLLANLSYDALSHYAAAVDGLRSANDLLWLASALEGICAATIICKSKYCPRGDYVLTPGSAAVLPEGKGRRSPSFNAVATKDDNAVATVPSLNANLLSTNDVIERYLEAIKIYNRINVAPLIELEANIKLANVLASADKKVETSETLMRILYTNYPLSEEQKIQRYCFVSHIYEKINFGRKAAFISRIASMQCLSRNITNHPWIAVYSLMKKALKGYNLHPDFQLCAKDRSGWPALQLHVLKELIMCSRHLNDPAIASRLLIFILQFMDSSLSDSDKQTYCALLEMQSKNITGSPYQFTFNRNYGSQPMAMTMFPCIIQFTIVPLPTQLRPVKMLANTDSDNQNCFIFSALQKRSTKGKTDEIPITIQNETLRVEIKLVNPMPLEVKVSKMTLLVDDIAFDPHPAAIALPPKSEPVSMMLTGIPCSKGKLHILGYSSQVFGLNSLCTSTFCNESLRREIDVIPALPLIRISSTLSPGFVVTTSNEIQTLVTNLTTYTGER
ncbi:uncharacterized protein TRIADDRAFT_31873 [Trichoplax adhaerens]|uniref:Uncharacterized protein n=1 Tax=Trichoplax adhaerens TaxID=10228 RepID=B3S9W1_TRIAD|nr:hypothetical protein TRIADDRAFT_31873 [Trichoplax adhaerens]EDV20405.1 hypothetical protein TRIADDRAFT_31873 [Trichoplax adhaerens]|eukprot:XP_002117099.1 hypothetical protein TRIADDRAFT_31873 [Trichoplax adhaerens]